MKKVLFALTAACCLAGAGCKTADVETKPASEAKKLALAERAIGADIIEAFRQDSYEKLQPYLSPEIKDQFSETQFADKTAEIRRGLGEISEYHYLTALEAPVFKSQIWKVTFVRKNRDGSEVTQQVLFRLVTGELDGKPVTVGFWFI